ncbi:dual specificity catalytic domain-containing protein, partial [Cystoisospora suis]
MLNSFSHPPPPPHNRTLREEEEADSLLGGRLHSFQEDQKEIEKMMAMKKKKKETTITSPNDRMVLSMIGFLHPTQQSHAMVNASNTPPLHEEEEEQEEEEEEEEDDLMGDLLFGAAKIKDGLFIGDLHAAQDLDFLMSNKITHIVNCSCIDTPNFFQDPRHYHLGIAYLSFPWTRHEPAQSFLENETEGLLSRKIFYFIERCLEKGESCLIQSARGQSRACMVLIAYLME